MFSGKSSHNFLFTTFDNIIKKLTLNKEFGSHTVHIIKLPAHDMSPFKVMRPEVLISKDEDALRSCPFQVFADSGNWESIWLVSKAWPVRPEECVWGNFNSK